ncbi:MAG: hypothetical protein COV47_03450 [Candidatus Diapherotrites archaeon CG11_big_fil_rev_8_21_14_0_20_37_9]|nr:MAG: hypothetical protein COV47_03450 [Candidatus Diapherotrites archaeon CG11_big_fil_rev_8_21_14_0_20_37_9]
MASKNKDEIRVSSAIFFVFHYGFFHFIYAMFLGVFLFEGAKLPVDFSTVLIMAVVFFINHLFSFIYNRDTELAKVQNIGKVVFSPYLRIIPMHLTIIFGMSLAIFGWLGTAVILFILLKTATDALMHIIEHTN